MKKPKNKKAQVQSGETIIVIIIVTIMIIIGLVIASKTKTRNATEESTALNEIDTMKIALIASSLNELKCSEYSAMVKTCMDYHRILSFRDTVLEDKQSSKNYYYSLLGDSEIKIKMIMPDQEPSVQVVTLYKYDNISANKSSSSVFIPLIVFNTMEKENYFSVLEVRKYS